MPIDYGYNGGYDGGYNGGRQGGPRGGGKGITQIHRFSFKFKQKLQTN